MKISTPFQPIKYFIKEQGVPFVVENRKIIFQFIFTLLFIASGIWFIKHERTELLEVRHTLATSQLNWFLLGIALTIVYILLQALMYVSSFASLQKKISLLTAVSLFLKRYRNPGTRAKRLLLKYITKYGTALR